jgi:hypothetical protein
MAQGKIPSLRLAELHITGFRSLLGRTTIPLGRGDGAGEPLVVFQGENGVGKSSIFAALELFFRAAIACLAAGASGSSDAELTARWDLITSVGHRDLLLRRRDRPSGHEGPMQIEGRFADAALGVLRVSVVEEGSGARVKLEHSARGQNFFEPDRALCAGLLASLEHPCGEGSRPLAAMNARRRALWLPEEASAGPLPAGLLVQLFRLRTSLDPADRRRWRAFTETLGRLGAFAGKEISVERTDTGAPQLFVEDPGRSVVPLPELGAGEQHLIALAAAVLLGRGSILAVEKPELCLDARHQRAIGDLLESQAREGQVGQVLLESNAPGFARGLLVRLGRGAGGGVTAERAEPASAPAPAPRREAARV